MSLSEFASRSDPWLANLRAQFEGSLSPAARDSSTGRIAVSYTVRLIQNGLDYAVAAQTQLVERNYVDVAITLGQELSHIDDEDEAAVIVYWSVIGGWYGRALAEIAHQVSDVDELANALTLLLINWGAFYSRLNLPPVDSEN